MNLIVIILIGFAVGLVAKLIFPGRGPGGFILTSLLGIAGALTASYLGQSFGYYQFGQPAGFVSSVLGAILLLAGYRLLSR